MSSPSMCVVCGDTYVPTWAKGAYVYCSPKCARAARDQRSMVDDPIALSNLVQGDWDTPPPTYEEKRQDAVRARRGSYITPTTAEQDEQAMALKIAQSGTTEYDHLSDEEWELKLCELSGTLGSNAQRHSYRCTPADHERRRKYEAQEHVKVKRKAVNKRYREKQKQRQARG